MLLSLVVGYIVLQSLVWALYRIIPDGKTKAALFRVRSAWWGIPAVIFCYAVVYVVATMAGVKF